MAAYSGLLFAPGEGPKGLESLAPAYLPDLNIGQVIAALTAGREQYDLEPFFWTALRTVDGVAYRHEVFRDLEEGDLREHIAAFGRRMEEVRACLDQAKRAHYDHEKRARFLHAAILYGEAVDELARDLMTAGPRSRALRDFRTWLDDYTASPAYRTFRDEASHVGEALAAIRYCLTIKGLRVTVSVCEDLPDYSADVLATFERFRVGVAGHYRADLAVAPFMDHVQAQIVDLVARLYPDEVSALATFCERHGGFIGQTIAAFDREAQFYLACLDHRDGLRAAGLPFSYPEVDEHFEEVGVEDAFDIALAGRLVPDGRPVVLNSFSLTGRERILVVSGPNQGGKTTFARMVGQLHWLAGLGCPIPARRARLLLCDRVFTHFEREEDVASLSGKLEDDLNRVHEILREATSRSVVIMNESLTGTTIEDATVIGRWVLERLIDRRAVCVFVTFIDDLATLGPETVSMVGTVAPDNPATRTYRVLRKPPEGLAYAAAIAGKYRLTYDLVKERLSS